MKTQKSLGFICWAPRILTVLFIIFISLFALDAFSPELTFWQSLFGFFVHLIPSFILLAVLLISWKREIVGGIFFVLASLAYAFMSLQGASMDGNLNSAWKNILIIGAPAFLIGILFLVNWLKRK
jgi:hypothetical protein